MARLKKSKVQVKAESNCLAHALCIAKARVDHDPNYKAYCDSRSRKISLEVQYLLEKTGINLDNGVGIRDLIRFREHFNDYKIVVYAGLIIKLHWLFWYLSESLHGYPAASPRRTLPSLFLPNGYSALSWVWENWYAATRVMTAGTRDWSSAPTFHRWSL
jgi:hypothetical protein